MKTTLLTLSAASLAVLAATPVLAARNFTPNSGTFSTIVDVTEFQAIPGFAAIGFSPYLVIVTENSELVVVSDPGGLEGGWAKFDLAGANGQFVTLESTLITNAGLDGTDIDYGGFAVDGSNVYIAEFDTNDETFVYNVATNAVRRLNSNYAGIGQLAISNDGSTVYVYTNDNFGGPADWFASIPASATDGTYTAVPAGPLSGVAGGIDVLPNGQLVFFAETGFGGDDSFKSVDPATGTVTTIADTTNASISPAGAAGVDTVAVDEEGNIYFADFFNAGDDAIRVLTTEGQIVDLATRADYLTAIGAASVDLSNDESMDVEIISDTEVRLYFADRNAGRVVMLTVPTTVTSVENWDLY